MSHIIAAMGKIETPGATLAADRMARLDLAAGGIGQLLAAQAAVLGK